MSNTKTFGEILIMPKRTNNELKAIAKELAKVVSNPELDVQAQIQSLGSSRVADRFFFWLTYSFMCQLSEFYQLKQFDERNLCACFVSNELIKFANASADAEQFASELAAIPNEAIMITNELANLDRVSQEVFAKACFYYLDSYKNINTYAPRTWITNLIPKHLFESWWNLPIVLELGTSWDKAC